MCASISGHLIELMGATSSIDRIQIGHRHVETHTSAHAAWFFAHTRMNPGGELQHGSSEIWFNGPEGRSGALKPGRQPNQG